ncbi:MAG: 16S rRNA (cytidine(1402)-2'-O)-methyltransferase [Bacteroidetes bacterium HGW-Bacteroidetes-9]|jgi:16S rRNA (cytidine1402-2'-O)-methyltransferase|nr:MAG: 16S rRNA (cytidine(1402)-2'-O)-methyltransferase [Bacteroidetes bacterium HGW-Bacteroidetes-9]
MPKLYLVPTPIGNLEDMTFRAVRILKEVNVILAEDTRKTGMLLKHFGIENKLASHHMHNEHRTAENIAGRIAAGESIALVTDAGTPGISDPGFLLVRTCIAMGLEVESLPGPTAFVPALVNSGLPCDRFYFEGFLPHKKGRQTRLAFLSSLTYTIVLYESPFRLVKTLEQLAEMMGPDRKACVSRELTKMFEENRRGTLSELASYYGQTTPKGEIVITIAGAGSHEI